MHTLEWDKIGERTFQTGVDRGVLYLPGGAGVPWSGLTSVSEKSDVKSSPVYYDGQKIIDLVTLGTFSASLKALTYPDEFLEVEGQGSFYNGVSISDQMIKTFGLSYRTRIGNDLDQDAGYKIHLIYNVTAIPKNHSYNTIQEDISLIEFEWDLLAVPIEVEGFRPSAHIVIDSTEVDPWLLQDLENILYGDGTALGEPKLLDPNELRSFLESWFRYIVTDNYDGTVTISTTHPEGITVNSESDIYTIIDADVVFLDNEGTYRITTTKDRKDIWKVYVEDNGDGTWWASSPRDELIKTEEDGYFEIHEADSIPVTPDSYRIKGEHYF